MPQINLEVATHSISLLVYHDTPPSVNMKMAGLTQLGECQTEDYFSKKSERFVFSTQAATFVFLFINYVLVYLIRCLKAF